ncbi:MAG: hypothetical protein L0Y57_02595 [Beijerinckiaceae bacterium]|nr:hypothetical protein [Beijerinckiaceae bacterium]
MAADDAGLGLARKEVVSGKTKGFKHLIPAGAAKQGAGTIGKSWEAWHISSPAAGLQ